MIEITFRGDDVLAEIQAFAVQAGAGARLVAMAREHQAAKDQQSAKDVQSVLAITGAGPEKAEAAAAAAAAPEPEKPAPRKPKPKADTPKQEPISAAPVVENVAEDVFDDAPAVEDVSQDPQDDVPKTFDDLKTFCMRLSVLPNTQLAIWKKYSPTGKLSGVPQKDYPALVRDLRAAAGAK